MSDNTCDYCHHLLLDHATGKCSICGCPGSSSLSQQDSQQKSRKASGLPRFEIKSQTLLVLIFSLVILSLLFNLINLAGTSSISKNQNILGSSIAANVNSTMIKTFNNFSVRLTDQTSNQLASLQNLEGTITSQSTTEASSISGLSTAQQQILTDQNTELSNQATIINNQNAEQTQLNSLSDIGNSANYIELELLNSINASIRNISTNSINSLKNQQACGVLKNFT